MRRARGMQAGAAAALAASAYAACSGRAAAAAPPPAGRRRGAMDINMSVDIRRINRLADHMGNSGLSADPAAADVRGPALPGRPELVPFGFEGELLRSRWARNHLQWMRRKDMLDQDIYLLGSHGPLRRWLALVFCHRMAREVEYVALTQDTTESDLKQRREIVEGGSALYYDQAPVRAAVEGRVLVRVHQRRCCTWVLRGLCPCFTCVAWGPRWWKDLRRWSEMLCRCSIICSKTARWPSKMAAS